MSLPQSFIKSVAIQINGNYDLHNAPFDIAANKNKKEGVFIGRTQHRRKFLEFLKHGGNCGVFLVTGYRGMGKTSFVNHVLREYIADCKTERNLKKRSKKIIPIHLTLTQNNPQELDILRLIVTSVYDQFAPQARRTHLETFFKYVKASFWLLLLISLPLLLRKFCAPLLPKSELIKDDPAYDNFAIGFAAVYMFLYLIAKYLLISDKGPYFRLRRLYERCYNGLSEEISDTPEAAFPLFNLKIFGGGEKRTRQQAAATSKEIEYEMQKFLDEKKDKWEFIFIFDELDKVEPVVGYANLYGDIEESDKQKSAMAYERGVRERKQAVTNVIAGLKNFFTSAKARFVFIAGNEMFDASLADVSDRQSSISSIFTYVFNIESLLKEKDLIDGEGNTNNLSLSDGIQLYLKSILFNLDEKALKKKPDSLYQMARKEYLVNDEEKDKVCFILQNFVTYLTYRSNGSTKKLIREIHEFLKVDESNPDQKDQPTDPAFYTADQTIVARLDGQPTGLQKRYYLYFNYYNQYRIGFINYLYRPFLIRYGRSFKLYSDNIIVSTPYLFDHLIKFHPFAFSLSYLEMVPEILSPNKTPAVRAHIKKIIEYLGGSHIREIEAGLFDYKFSSRTLNEITYLSKIYEQEAAAMNYTLDESYMIKLQQINKIKELRSIYATVNTSADTNKQIFSIAHLNATLGDLHFFDQEYDNAIVAYSDSIRPLTQQFVTTMNMQDFVTLTRNRLKIGLSFEKINSYEDALAHYSNACMDAIRFMRFRIDNENFVIVQPDPFDEALKAEKQRQHASVVYKGIDQHPEGSGALYHSAALSDLLQIILQAFLAQIYIQEKKSVAGISTIKMAMSIGSYFKITEGFLNNGHRNHILKASAFLHCGNLMFFKNNDLLGELPPEVNHLLPKNIVEALNDLSGHFKATFTSQHRDFSALSTYLYLLGLIQTTAFSNEINFIQEQVAAVCGPANNLLYYLNDAFVKKLNPEKSQNYRHIRFHFIATFYSNIGDNLFSILQSNGNQHFEFSDIFDPAELQNTKLATFGAYLVKAADKPMSIADIFRCYLNANQFYEMEGRSANMINQQLKILYLLRMVINPMTKQTERKAVLDIILRCVVNPLLRLSSQNAEHADYHMRSKAEKEKVNATFALNNLSNHPQTREIILLYNYIRVRIGDEEITDTTYFKDLISPNYSFATQQTRILELAFMANFIDSRYKKDKAGKFVTPLPAKFADEATEYIYCRLSMIQLLDIYGADYWMGHSYAAFTHFALARYLKALKLHTGTLTEVQQKLTPLLGSGSYASTNPKFHFAKAKRLYEQSIQLHTAGDAYRAMTEDLIFLEDDFNDNAYHFGAAMERHLMNNGVFEKRIQECKLEIMDDPDFAAALYWKKAH